MNLARGNRANSTLKIRQVKGNQTIGLNLNPDSVLIIKLPASRFLRIISRSLFLAIVILVLPSIASFVRDASLTSALAEEHSASHDFLRIVFKDLLDEGLLKSGHKGLLLSPGIKYFFYNLLFLNDKGIDLVVDSDSDSDRERPIPNEVFDFVFALSFENTKFINSVLELDGIVVLPLGNYYDRSYEFLKQSNYKIVYLRQFDLITIIAMKKIDGEAEDGVFGG